MRKNVETEGICNSILVERKGANMKMFKKQNGLISHMLLLLLVVGLSGCGNADHGSGGETPPPTIKESTATPEPAQMVSLSNVEPGRCDGNPGGDPECITKPTHIRLDDVFPGLGYWIAHGTTSPDQTEVLISATETLGNSPVFPVLPGVILYSVLDARALEKGHIQIKRTGYSTSMPGMGYALAPRWSHDGKMIAVAAHDRLYVLNSEDLRPLNGPLGVQLQYAGTDVETHDAIFTADDKYIILNVRFVRDGLTTMDSGLQLYSVAEQRLVGLPSSTCDACHRKTAPHVMNAESCNMDGIVNPVETSSFRIQNLRGDGPTSDLTSGGLLDLKGILGGAGTQTHGYGDVTSIQNPLGPVYDLVSTLLPSDLIRAVPMPIPWLDINAYLSQYAHAGLDNLISGTSIPSSPLAAVLTMIPQIAISDIADPISALQGLPIVGPLVSGGGLPFLGAFPGDSGADSVYAYTGRVILGGYSQHFAVADIAIDPRQPSPITVTSLNKAVVRTTGLMMHGASIDSRNPDIFYWAANKMDATAFNHYGSLNLKTGEVVEKEIDYPFVGIPPALPYQEWFYCASLQTAGYYMPISMTMPGYVTVIPKSTIK